MKKKKKRIPYPYWISRSLVDDVHGSREHPVTLKFQVIVNQTTEKNRPTCTENSVIYSRVIAI